MKERYHEGASRKITVEVQDWWHWLHKEVDEVLGTRRPRTQFNGKDISYTLEPVIILHPEGLARVNTVHELSLRAGRSSSWSAVVHSRDGRRTGSSPVDRSSWG